jgi:preprotein translocase subunit YajC
MDVLQSLLPWVVVLVIFYLLLILPEQRKNKKFKAMLESLKSGDEILTKGGIYGKIVNIKDEYMIIESGAEKTRIKISRGAVGSVISTKEAKEEETKEAKES